MYLVRTVYPHPEVLFRQLSHTILVISGIKYGKQDLGNVILWDDPTRETVDEFIGRVGRGGRGERCVWYPACSCACRAAVV